MSKLPKLRNIIVLLAMVFIANLLAWAFHGKDNSIILVGEQLIEHQKNYTSPINNVTISNTQRRDDLPSYYTVFGDYNESKQQKLITKIQSKGIIVENIGSVEKPDHSNPEYGFYIISGIPLYSKVTTTYLRGLGSTMYDGYYIYFFGWHNIIIHSSGIS